MVITVETYDDAEAVIGPVTTEDGWGARRALGSEAFKLADGTSVRLNTEDWRDNYVNMCLDREWIVGHINDEDDVEMVRAMLQASAVEEGKMA